MAAAQRMEPGREAALRRVAIVLSSLPAPIASRLLGTIDSESKHQLRTTMSALADVDPMERRLALQAFKGSVEQQQTLRSQSVRPSGSPTHATRAGDVEDEIIISRGDHAPTDRRPTARVISQREASNHSSRDSRSAGSNADETPLAFLSEVENDTLLSLLEGEHTQTIALVLASIAPTQAAHILPRLEERLQRETLSRIGRLEEIPDETVVDIADHLRERIQQQTRQTDDSSGNRALNAILAAMPNVQSPSAGAEQDEFPANSASRVPVESVGFPSTAVPAIDQLHRSRGTETSRSEQDTNWTGPAGTESSQTGLSGRADLTSDDSELDSNRPPTLNEATVFESTDKIHQYLIDLTPSALCQALGKVETRVALLTLCGLPSEVAESVLTILPRSHAKEVRRQLRSLGSLQLREIDQAKEHVARASISKQSASTTAQQTAATKVPIAA